jgi:hypothetical protein
MPAVKQSWKDARRQPRTAKRLVSHALLGQRSGRSIVAAAEYMTTIETSSRARLKATGLMASETRHRERTRLYPLKTTAPMKSARCARAVVGPSPIAYDEETGELWHEAGEPGPVEEAVLVTPASLPCLG